MANKTDCIDITPSASTTLEQAYQYCEKLARTHYENFPVASWFLPKKIRRPIAVIYAFARMADDIADEGELSKAERLSQLQQYWNTVESINQGITQTEPVFIGLQQVIQNHKLPISLFLDLLRAFKQDVEKTSYANHEEILDYCRYSANPVGRLLLHLTNHDTEENLTLSDSICTALQLINFLQDWESDITARNRCYLPLDELKKHNIPFSEIINKKKSYALQQLILSELNRATLLLQQGKPLCSRLPFLFGLEIRLIILGGMRAINRMR